MRYLLLVFCIMLSNVMLWGNGQSEIKLDKSQIGCEKDRSISVEPTASYDNNFIYIHSNVLLDALLVSIKNGNGEVLMCETIMVPSEQPVLFSIGSLENGTYILELNDGKCEYWGSFEVEEGISE